MLNPEYLHYDSPKRRNLVPSRHGVTPLSTLL